MKKVVGILVAVVAIIAAGLIAYQAGVKKGGTAKEQTLRELLEKKTKAGLVQNFSASTPSLSMPNAPKGPDDKNANATPKTSYNATVVSIDKNKKEIKVTIKNVYKGGDLFSFLSEPDSFAKTIKLADGSSVKKEEMKSQDQLKQEVGSLPEIKPVDVSNPEQISASIDEIPVSASPFSYKDVSLDDVKTGDQIIFSVSGQTLPAAETIVSDDVKVSDNKMMQLPEAPKPVQN